DIADASQASGRGERALGPGVDAKRGPARSESSGPVPHHLNQCALCSAVFWVFTSVLTFTSTSVLSTFFWILSPVRWTSLAISAPIFCAVLPMWGGAFL